MCIFTMQMSHMWDFSTASPCNYGEWRDRAIHLICLCPHIAAAYEQQAFFKFTTKRVYNKRIRQSSMALKADLKVSLTFQPDDLVCCEKKDK